MPNSSILELDIDITLHNPLLVLVKGKNGIHDFCNGIPDHPRCLAMDPKAILISPTGCNIQYDIKPRPQYSCNDCERKNDPNFVTKPI
jgi:hypothetical protein